MDIKCKELPSDISPLRIISKPKELNGFLENSLTPFLSLDVTSAQLIKYLVKQIGCCEILLSTYSLDMPTIKSIEVLKRKNKINTLTLIVDYRVMNASPRALQFARTIADEVILDRIHAKIWLFKNEKRQVVVNSSINLNTSKMKNAGTITTDESTFNFMLSYFN